MSGITSLHVKIDFIIFVITRYRFSQKIPNSGASDLIDTFPFLENIFKLPVPAKHELKL